MLKTEAVNCLNYCPVTNKSHTVPGDRSRAIVEEVAFLSLATQSPSSFLFWFPPGPLLLKGRSDQAALELPKSLLEMQAPWY
jgi:hypothetical protein